MRRSVLIVFLIVCAISTTMLWRLPLIASVVVNAGDEKPAPQADKVQPQSIKIPEIDSLRWLNLKLDAQSRRNKAEALLSQADQLDQQAEAVDLDTKIRLCKEAGVSADDYFIQPAETGRVLVRKPKKDLHNPPEIGPK